MSARGSRRMIDGMVDGWRWMTSRDVGGREVVEEVFVERYALRAAQLQCAVFESARAWLVCLSGTSAVIKGEGKR